MLDAARFESVVGRRVESWVAGSLDLPRPDPTRENLMRALITGITGFAGSHLAEFLLAEHPDVEVFGTYRWRSRMENIEHLALQGEAARDRSPRLHLDVHALDRSRPDFIFHLAAQSFVPTSWSAPNETLTINVSGQTNLFEAIRALKLDPWSQIACSSEEYGLVLPDEVPIKETNPLRPLSPLRGLQGGAGLSGYQYFLSYGLKAIRTRGFNHTGPRRGEVFVTSNFASQVARSSRDAGAGRSGSAISRRSRDFTDVRDMVRAYWLAVNDGKPGEVYNIATGHGIRIRELLEKLLALSNVEVEIKVDPERLRPSTSRSCSATARSSAPTPAGSRTIPFEQTVRDLLDYWRRDAGRSARHSTLGRAAGLAHARGRHRHQRLRRAWTPPAISWKKGELGQRYFPRTKALRFPRARGRCSPPRGGPSRCCCGLGARRPPGSDPHVIVNLAGLSHGWAKRGSGCSTCRRRRCSNSSTTTTPQ